MTDKITYGVAYIAAHTIEVDADSYHGWGVHAYTFTDLPSVRYPKVPALITPNGYEAKPTGIQLKNDSYNPEYVRGDIKIRLKDASVAKEGSCDIEIFDIFAPPVNNHSEGLSRLAFNNLTLECIDVDDWIIYTTDHVFYNNYTKHLDRWAKNNFEAPNGTPIENSEEWKLVHITKNQYGDKLKLKLMSVKTDEMFGLDSATRNAALGCGGHSNMSFSQGCVTTSVFDTNYWEPHKLIPAMLQMKWCYSLSEQERGQVSIDGEQYYEYMLGDHNKHKDDIELLGKKMSDAGFAFVAAKKKVDLIDDIIDYHIGKIWDNESYMYTSQVICMVSLDVLSKPKVIWEISNAKFENLWLKAKNNNLVSHTDSVISKVLRPVKLSYRILDEQHYLRRLLYSYLRLTGRDVDTNNNLVKKELTITDVTDFFFTQDVKKDGTLGVMKLGKNYSLVDRYVDLTVSHPCKEACEKDLVIRMVRGIDMPTRNHMAKFAPINPKVSVITWKYAKRAFKYAMIIETDEGFGIWSSVYSNVRLISD